MLIVFHVKIRPGESSCGKRQRIDNTRCRISQPCRARARKFWIIHTAPASVVRWASVSNVPHPVSNKLFRKSPTPCLNPCSHSHAKPPVCPVSRNLFKIQSSRTPMTSPPCLAPGRFPLALISKKARASANPKSHPCSNRQCSNCPPGAVESQ